LQAAGELVSGLPDVTFLPVLRRGNVRGAIAAGLTPGEGGLDAAGILEGAASGRISCLVLLGADPLADFPDAALARRGFAGVSTVLAVDTHLNGSSSLARVVLPAAAFGEKAGTTTNVEGRVTPLSQRVTAPGTARADWIIAADLATRLGGDLGVTTLDDLHDQLVTTVPAFAPASRSALAAERDGVLLAAAVDGSIDVGDHQPAPTRNAYDVRLVVSRKLYDLGTALKASPSLGHLAGGPRLHVHPLDLDRLGATTATHLKVSSARTSLVLEAEADAGVPRGLAWLAFNRADAEGRGAGELIDSGAGAIDLRVENL
jgi:NADH-quinone oxidoreductase subunit G